MDLMLAAAPDTARNLRSLVAARNGFNFGVDFTLYVILVLAAYVLLVVAWWKIFTKAGEKGWKALIPFYNFYVFCKFTWSKRLFWVAIILVVAAYVFTGLALCAPIRLRSLFWICAIIVWVLRLGFFVFVNYNVSKSFGHGWGYTIGLVFLDFVFTLILAFGKSEYVGNAYLQTVGKQEPIKPHVKDAKPTASARPKAQVPHERPAKEAPKPPTPRAGEAPKHTDPQHRV